LKATPTHILMARKRTTSPFVKVGFHYKEITLDNIIGYNISYRIIYFLSVDPYRISKSIWIWK